MEVDYPEGIDRYKYFARFLLEGKVNAQLHHFLVRLVFFLFVSLFLIACQWLLECCHVRWRRYL